MRSKKCWARQQGSRKWLGTRMVQRRARSVVNCGGRVKKGPHLDSLEADVHFCCVAWLL